MAKETVEVRNVNHPDYRGRVDAAKYQAMKAALLKGLTGSDGMTQAQMKEAALPYLPEDLFPGGKTSGWWAKTVQLDLEAKGAIKREPGKPTRWYRAE